MELECEPEKEYEDIFLLSCFIEQKPGDDEDCLICHDVNNTYDKYKLTCKHSYHTRCYRRYCFYKKAIKCPLCNDVIDDIIYNYNHSVNRGIGIEPYKVNNAIEVDIINQKREETDKIKVRKKKFLMLAILCEY